MPSPVNTPGMSKADQERLVQSGIDLNMENRCGSYLQMNQEVMQAECEQEGIEVLSYKQAMEKYDWLKDYNWNVVSPEKDEITRYVAAQKDPKGYVIIAHPGTSTILPIQACLYLGNDAIQHVHKYHHRRRRCRAPYHLRLRERGACRQRRSTLRGLGVLR